MAPVPVFTEHSVISDTKLNGDEVVISGISGLFPKSESVVEFMENLYNKVDMVSKEEPRWKFDDPDVPKHAGVINGAYKFDAQFFGVTFHLASAMEPLGRKLMEQAYSAIFDSGTSPQSLKGKKIGVFVGSSYTDSSSLMLFKVQKRSDFVINGSSKSMFANRISYWIDGKGPSYTLDCSDASSSACLEKACDSIKSGECEAAIVGGFNHVAHPILTYNLRRSGLLCLDGKTKCYDKNGDGYVRADAVNVIFLQKAKDAHRIYAELYHVKSTRSLKLRPDAQFLPYRERDDIVAFLNEVYSETDVDPKEIEYVEGQGAGLAKADANELNAISHIFTNDKTVKVGSVKSNMGNSEPASGLCSVTKLCLAYHKGKLPANLHYNEPPEDVHATQDGRVNVLSEESAFGRGFTAINNFSATGANYHFVLKGHYKEKNINKYKSDIPYLILASGRQQPGVEKIINYVRSHTIDPEEIGLLHKIFEHDITGHIGRGYTILDTNENKETVCLSERAEHYPGGQRPLWFVYSGMGSQWIAMGADLMRIPTFAAAIHKCHKALEPLGLDLVDIITNPNGNVIEGAFVGIGSIQIGLTDVLKEIGIVPDKIIGHSLGELACAYCDGTLTAEEVILSTYHRGKTIADGQNVEGLMAAIGLGYQAIVNQCPPEIDIACHNSSESSTISGPVEIVKEFVEELTKRGVFAREVQCGGIAYHSRYIAYIETTLLKKLQGVVKDPKKRSNKWVSTSVPSDQSNEQAAVYASAEYLTNNMLRPVLFEENSKKIPENAIIVEIAPHGLLQAILKRSHTNCTHIPLARRGNPNGVHFLLEAIGQLYINGVNSKIEHLYPKIEFPVSTETSLLSHYVDWEHSEDWPVLSFLEKEGTATASARNFVMSVHDDDYKFLEGNVRDGINILPESALLVLVWETLSMHTGVNYRKQSVIFSDIHFHSEVEIKQEAPVRLYISVSRGNSQFEVSQGDIPIVSGYINGVKELKFTEDVVQNSFNGNFEIDDEIGSEDVYKILESKDFSPRGQFRSIQRLNLDFSQAYIEWNKNWITFLDALLQFNTIAHDYGGLSVPKFIKTIRINTLEQDSSIFEEVNSVKCFNAQFNKQRGIIRCGGVEIDNVTFTNKPVLYTQPDVSLSRSFHPHYSMDKVDLKTALLLNLQIVAENTVMADIKVTQLVTSNKNIKCIVQDLSNKVPNTNINVSSIYNVNEDYASLITKNSDAQKANVFIIENILGDEKKMKNIRNISHDTFVLAIETGVPKLQELIKQYFTVVSAMSDGKQILMLLRRQKFHDVTYIRVNSDTKFDWVTNVYDSLIKTKRVVILSEKLPYCGALGLVNKLRRDGENKIALVQSTDIRTPAFHPNHIIYKEQLDKELTVNVLNKGEWGGYYYLPAPTKITQRNITLVRTIPGDIDSLTWVESPAISASKSLVQVSYAGISMKDKDQIVSCDTSEETVLGMEYSGINKDGDRVMGLLPRGALSSTVEADPTLTWPVPEYWTLQDAATIPLPYAMAYYCMSMRAQLFKGQTVLVTGGAGALGQAIIALCLSLDCTIYVTVGNEHKKKMLLSLFPQLHKNKIGQSRNESFLYMIRSQTAQNNCDVVINCASGPLRETAMKCVADFGCFLDLSSYDMRENQKIGMSFLSGATHYKAVNLSNIFRPENLNDRITIHRQITEGIASGVVRPLSRIEYLPTAVSRAFRFLSSSKHVGKVLIKMRSPETMIHGFEAVPRLNFCANGVYIVICDESGVGIELAERLIKRGARKIILHLRTKANGYLHTKVISWQKYDVTVKISSDKIQTQDGCTKLIKDATRIGSVKGIFILQFSESDKNAQDFAEKFNKAISVMNLDVVSRNFCSELSYFVLLTTSSPLASEEFATSVSEKVCEARSELGAPVLILRGEGLIAHQNENGHPTQTLSQLFNAMETGLRLNYKNILSYNVKKPHTSQYLIKLQKILGVASLEAIKSDIVVSNLNLYANNLEEIKMLISNCHRISYPVDKIQGMTVESLKNIGSQTVERNREGLRAFYSCIDNEKVHMDTCHPIVPMITLLNNGVVTDLDPTKTYLVMIPGFEARHQIFKLTAERLKIEAVAVQLDGDLEGNSIPEIAINIRKYMKTKFETKSKFYLLGYSFGVNIALELAALLEKEGHIGVVVCLDSSPDALRIQLNTNIETQNDSQIQNIIIEHVYELVSGHNVEPLESELVKAETWSDKIDIFMKKTSNIENYSNQYKRLILESAFRRITLAKAYEPDFKLQSEIVLIKGIPHPKSVGLTKDYNLSKYTHQPVKVFQIKSDHQSAPYDCRVSNIVNKTLDNNLLEEFQNKNLCDVYRRYFNH